MNQRLYAVPTRCEIQDPDERHVTLYEQWAKEYACTFFGSLLGECVLWPNGGPAFVFQNQGPYVAALTTESELKAQISQDLPDNIRLQLIVYAQKKEYPTTYALGKARRPRVSSLSLGRHFCFKTHYK